MLALGFKPSRGFSVREDGALGRGALRAWLCQALGPAVARLSSPECAGSTLFLFPPETSFQVQKWA